VFANPLINLLSALFVAVSPWSITLSRTAHEVEVGMVFTYIALLAILYAARLLGKKGTNNQSSYMKVNTIFVVSFLLLLTSIFTYGSQRIFIPSVLLGLTAVAYFYKNELSNVKSRLAILFVIITALVGLSLIPWQARGRASGVVWRGVSQDQITNDAIYDGTGVIKTPIILTRIYHNKISENILDFSQNYLKNFNFNYLFFTGDTSPESTPQTGIVLHIELLLFVVGLLGVWKRQRGSNKAIPFVILITGAGASAITLGGPHMLRGSNMFPAIALFSAYGFFYIANSLVKNLWRKIVLILLGLLIFVNASFTTHQIFIHKPVQRPWYSDQTKAQLVSDTWSMRNNYKAVVMKEYPYIFFLFYNKISPSQFLANSDIMPESRDNQWERVNSIDNIYFGMPFDCPKGGKINVLYVCKGSEVPQNAQILKTYYFLDGIPAYSLIEFYPFSEKNQAAELPSMFNYMVERETKYPDGVIPNDIPGWW